MLSQASSEIIEPVASAQEATSKHPFTPLMQYFPVSWSNLEHSALVAADKEFAELHVWYYAFIWQIPGSDSSFHTYSTKILFSKIILQFVCSFSLQRSSVSWHSVSEPLFNR